MTWSVKVIHIASFIPSPNHFLKGVWCTNTSCTRWLPWNLPPIIILPPDKMCLGGKTQILAFQKFPVIALTWRLLAPLSSSHASLNGAPIIGQIMFSSSTIKAIKGVSFSPTNSMPNFPPVSVKSEFNWNLLLTLLFLFRPEFHLWIWKHFKAVTMFHSIFEMQVDTI